MAHAQFRAEGQRLERKAFYVEAVRLPRAAIYNLSAVGRPREIRDMPLRLKHILRAQRRDVCEHDGIIGPIAANFDHAGKNSFIRAESRAPVSAECAFFAEFRFVGLPLEAVGHAHFFGWRLRERQRACFRNPQPQARAFAACRGRSKKIARARPCQARRKILELSKRAQEHFPVQIENVQRGLPRAPRRHQMASARRPRERGGKVLRRGEASSRTSRFLRPGQRQGRAGAFNVIKHHALRAAVIRRSDQAHGASRGNRQTRRGTREHFLDQPVRIARHVPESTHHESCGAHCEAARSGRHYLLAGVLCGLQFGRSLARFHDQPPGPCGFSRRRLACAIWSSTFCTISFSTSRPWLCASSRRTFNWYKSERSNSCSSASISASRPRAWLMRRITRINSAPGPSPCTASALHSYSVKIFRSLVSSPRSYASLASAINCWRFARSARSEVRSGCTRFATSRYSRFISGEDSKARGMASDFSPAVD